MKIAFISSFYSPSEFGGAEKAVRVIAENALKAGHEAIVISIAADGVERVADVNGVRVYYVPLANVGALHGGKPMSKLRKLLWYIVDAYNPIMGARVAKILRAEKPDVIEANNLQGFSASIWHVAKRLSIPVVQVLHDYYLGCVNSTMHTNKKNCEKQCSHCKVLTVPRKHFSNVPAIVSSVSRRTLERVRNVGVFNGVQDFRFCSSAIVFSELTGDFKRAHHEPGTPVVLGFLGRIDPLKGVDVLLEAVAGMPAGSVRLLIGGTINDAYAQDLKDRFTSPNIEFLGFIKPQELFAQIHMLIVPSIWEDPLPRVITESHANGVPVAISKLGGMPEIVEDGVTGYHFEANSVTAIRDLLNRLAGESFPTPAQVQACLDGRDKFSVDRVIQHHLAMWEKAASQTAASRASKPVQQNDAALTGTKQ